MKGKKIVYVTNNYYGQRRPSGKPNRRIRGGTWATDIGEENSTIYDRPY
ncbi:MAG TPA: hypothetical protein O0X97_04495 [Methanocorpusculum sp.]|nr:hypothetical protein [Methanocorpusculum sp.]